MFHPAADRPRTLLVTLFVPIVILLVATAAAGGVIDYMVEIRTVERLATLRGEVVLDNVMVRLQDWQRASEYEVQLLAHTSGLVVAADSGDTAHLTAVLAPMKARLGSGRIIVYSALGDELLRWDSFGLLTNVGEPLGPPSEFEPQSAITVGVQGLMIATQAPIRGPSGPVGTLEVDAALNAQALFARSDEGSTSLAVVKAGLVVNHSITNPEILATVEGKAKTASVIAGLNRELASRNLWAIGRILEGDGLLIAIVPTADLRIASGERNALLISMVGSLILGLLLLLFAHARRIARYTGRLVDAARHMMQGDYQQRVGPVGVRELDEVAGVLNHLSEKIEQQLADLARQALYDPLTDLPNRSLFMDRLRHSLMLTERRNVCTAVLFLDLDNFKVVNDSLGHHAGDDLLVGVAKRLQRCLHNHDTAARFGGDEFTIMVEEVGSPEQAMDVAERVRLALQEPFRVGDRDVFVSASIGVALSAPGRDAGALLKAADMAMYRAKASGKAHAEFFEPGMGDAMANRLQLETDLRRALERHEFQVYYQPIVDLQTGCVAGVEALVRWEHPQRGLLSPDAFIPLAEETGLITPLGRLVLYRACRQVCRWQTSPGGNPNLSLSVNLSAVQFQDAGLVRDVASMLATTGLAPGCLQLEITENVMVNQDESTLSMLRELKALGVGLAIDDFGKGYSSLGYLKHGFIDVIKVDRAFVQNVGQTAEDTAIVASVLSLALDLELLVVAEGIESAAQYQRLRGMGCDYGQGFYFSKPLAARALSDLLLSPEHRWDPRRSEEATNGKEGLSRPGVRQ